MGLNGFLFNFAAQGWMLFMTFIGGLVLIFAWAISLRSTTARLGPDKLIFLRFAVAVIINPIGLFLLWATDLYELEYEDPETLWQLILTIHSKDHSRRIQEVLSAGPVETLLDKYGEKFIERIEIQARQDPMFARLLGGVWLNSMTNSISLRVQRVWDRRGWDGIPE